MGFLFDQVDGQIDKFRRRGKVMPPSATFRLTELGRDKLQEFSGDPKSRILVALETRGTSDVKEVCEASGVSRGQAERLIPVLIKGGMCNM